MANQKINLQNSLFSESLMRWHVGDWEYLTQLDNEKIASDPDRGLLAMLKCAGLFQQGDLDTARRVAKIAIDFGVEPKVLLYTLISGIYNSFGCFAMLQGWEQRAAKYIKEAMCIGSMDMDGILVYPARLMQQKRQIDVKNNLDFLSNQRTPPSFPFNNQLQSQKKILSSEKNIDFAYQEMTFFKDVLQQGNATSKEYDLIIQNQKKTQSTILARSLAKKNAGLLEEAISDLEHSKAIGLFNSKMLHQLAVAYRDNQQWDEAEKIVRELIVDNPDYFNNIAFTTFVADFLRKRQWPKEAYCILTAFAEKLRSDGNELPLNTYAILQELQRAENTTEVSSFYYDTIYAQSDKYQDDPENSIYRPVWEKVVDILKLEKIQKILDIGCGPGQFAEYLMRKIPEIEYQGVDYSQTAIEKAKIRCPTAHFVVKNLMETDALKSFKADVFLILEVLEHIENDLELIERIPFGQKIIFSVPNRDSFSHVRFFKNQNSVYDRYNRLFSCIKILEIEIASASKIFLALAIKN